MRCRLSTHSGLGMVYNVCMRICQQCDQPLPESKRSDAMYCSKRCKSAVENKRYYKPSERPRASSKCGTCKGPIPPDMQATALYCGRTCKLRANRKHHANNRDGQKRSNSGYLPFTDAEWVRLKHRYGNACAYCGSKKRLEKDHVVPLSRGGRHALANILPCCRKCNMSKGNMYLVEWRQAGRVTKSA